MNRLFLLGLLCIAQLFADVPAETISEMIRVAMNGQKKAYAPYSQYFVGAAILTKSGKIYSGSNIENASYGLGNCAERTALFKAVSEGDHEFEAIAIVTRNGGLACGACRQVLNEFNPKILVIAADENGHIWHMLTLDQLLPKHLVPLTWSKEKS